MITIRATLLVLWRLRLQFFDAMYIPEKMKVNKFVDVAIPSNKSFFSRLGEVKVDPSSYTGDEVAPEMMSKTQSIEDYRQYAEEMSKKESADT